MVEIINENEFGKLVINEISFSEVLIYMIEEIGINTEHPIENISYLLADYYNITIDKINYYLRKTKFSGQNAIIGYLNGKPVRLRQIRYLSEPILRKIMKRINMSDYIELDSDSIENGVRTIISVINDKILTTGDLNFMDMQIEDEELLIDEEYIVLPIDQTLQIELVDTNAKIPSRGTPESAGMDVYAIETADILPNESQLFSLGWRCRMPAGYVMLVKDKSGRVVKDHLHVLAGVVDSDYRGIVQVYLQNFGKQAITIRQGEKIAQILIQKVWQGNPVQVNSVDMNTERGEGGFGSTGII